MPWNYVAEFLSFWNNCNKSIINTAFLEQIGLHFELIKLLPTQNHKFIIKNNWLNDCFALESETRWFPWINFVTIFNSTIKDNKVISNYDKLFILPKYYDRNGNFIE